MTISGTYVSARLLIPSYNGFQPLTITRLNSWISSLYGQDHHYSYDKVTIPASELINGANVFKISNTDFEHHGTEIMWPGPALLVRYAVTPDLIPPTQPNSLVGIPVSDTEVSLSWTASTDNVGPVSYRVRRNGVVVGAPSSATFTDTGLAASTAYTYSVTAVDPSENESASTPLMIVNTLSAAPVLPAGLSLWLRADAGLVTGGTAVSQWNDLSGNNRNATQGTVANQPTRVGSVLNGLPVVRFDGANDFLTFNMPVNGLTGMSIFLVAANTLDHSAGPTEAERAALFWNETVGWGTVYVSPFQSAVYARFGTTQTGNRLKYTRPTSVGSAFTMTETIKDGTTDSLYVNKVLVLSQGGKLTTLAGNQSMGNVGRGYNDNTYFRGDIAEAIVFGRALTIAERQSVEQYLDAKYGVTAPVPPKILSQSANVTVQEPAAANFSVTASGTAPLSFQWRRNGANIVGRQQQQLHPVPHFHCGRQRHAV